MGEMLSRVAKAIQEALKQPRYTVKIAHSDPLPWQCWDTENSACVLKKDNHTEVDDECERLNAQNIARKSVEVLKLDEAQINWLMSQTDYTGLVEWNRNLDAILKA